ncbi:MAG TPA: hypothetical protein VGF94_12755 [Kofleriaceae bacterium]
MIAALLVCGIAHADKPKPIDAKAVADKLEVFRDEFGNLYVVPKPDAFSFDDTQQWVFYGDSKALYQQRVVSTSQESGRQFEFGLWAPRAKGMQVASLENEGDKYLLRCRHTKDGVRPLVQLNADEARTVFAHAVFWPPLWQRQAHLLARDDDGVYYFVDRLRDELGGNGYRVFVGQKGAMKEIAMTNVVSDSAGEIFVTKTGQLKIVRDGDKGYWIRGGKKVELTMLEPTDNRYLIYRDLGIYGTLGAVCDDL